MSILQDFLNKQKVKMENEREQERIKKEEEKVQHYAKCCEECQLGNAEYMYHMSEYFYRELDRDIQKFFWVYLDNIKNDEVRTHFFRLSVEEQSQLTACATWIVRAAYYENETATMLLEKHPNLNTVAFFNMDFYTGKTRDKSFWSSKDLHEMGFVNVNSCFEDCVLNLWQTKSSKYYSLRYVSYYCPRDDDGYGEEIEYDYIKYDEFFNKIAS
ncbi:MAG: hypothetical protein R3Y27_04045 [Clostridia bacterium]